MTREIKFRVWLKRSNTMETWEEDKHNVCEFLAYEDGNYIAMQYTGLKDKNGVEIYEGDILKHDDGVLGEVAYHTWQPRFCLYLENSAWDYVSDYFDEEGAGGVFAVVGNIYENPELIN